MGCRRHVTQVTNKDPLNSTGDAAQPSVMIYVEEDMWKRNKHVYTDN